MSGLFVDAYGRRTRKLEQKGEEMTFAHSTARGGIYVD